ncbi:retrovirus-related pol polyprotein from transposon TNT 1-94 [Tanacetum coccineum]
MAWYETLSTFLIQNKFVKRRIDNTFFIYRSKGYVLLVQVYVDDIIFGSTSYKLCKQFEKLMTKKFEMSMMGEITYFLGLQIKQDYKGISICQEQYTRNLLKKYEISDSSLVKTPMVPPNNLCPDLASKPANETLYQANPKESHLIAVKKNPQIPERKSTLMPVKYLEENWSVEVLRNSSQWLCPQLRLNSPRHLCVYPSPEAVKAKLAKIATDEVLINRNPVLKTAFPVAWNILFTFVVQVSLPFSERKRRRVSTVSKPKDQKITGLLEALGFTNLTEWKRVLTTKDHISTENSTPLKRCQRRTLIKPSQSPQAKLLIPKIQREIMLAVKDCILHTDEGTHKSQPLPKGPREDKDLERLKPLADMESLTPPVTFLSGTDVEYEVDQTQSTRFEVLVPNQHQSKTYSEVELDFEPLKLITTVDIQALFGTSNDDLKEDSEDDVSEVEEEMDEGLSRSVAM